MAILYYFCHLGPMILPKKNSSHLEQKSRYDCDFCDITFFLFFFQSLDMESYWGPKAPTRACRALGAQYNIHRDYFFLIFYSRCGNCNLTGGPKAPSRARRALRAPLALHRS